MILIAPREKTAPRPVHLPLAPTVSELSSFASPARRNPSASNAFKMILLHNNKVKLPGIILLHEVNRPAGVVNYGDLRNPISISTLEENRSRKGRVRKPFRMITFSNPWKQLLWNDNVYKKGGGGPSGARKSLRTG